MLIVVNCWLLSANVDPLEFALLLSSIDELDAPAGLLLSGDQQITSNDILELSGDQR